MNATRKYNTCIDSGTRWTMQYLHHVGHPISPSEYSQAVALRDYGYSVDDAVSILEGSAVAA